MSLLKAQTRYKHPDMPGSIYFCVGDDQHGKAILVSEKRDTIFRAQQDHKYIEYKEPVVHRRDVVWYTYSFDPTVYSSTTEVGGALSPDRCRKMLHRQTVEYVEQE